MSISPIAEVSGSESGVVALRQYKYPVVGANHAKEIHTLFCQGRRLASKEIGEGRVGRGRSGGVRRRAPVHLR